MHIGYFSTSAPTMWGAVSAYAAVRACSFHRCVALCCVDPQNWRTSDRSACDVRRGKTNDRRVLWLLRGKVRRFQCPLPVWSVPMVVTRSCLDLPHACPRERAHWWRKLPASYGPEMDFGANVVAGSIRGPVDGTHFRVYVGGTSKNA